MVGWSLPSLATRQFLSTKLYSETTTTGFESKAFMYCMGTQPHKCLENKGVVMLELLG